MNTARTVSVAVEWSALGRGITWLCVLAPLGFAIALLPLPLAAGLVGGAIACVSVLAQPMVGMAWLLVTVPFGSLVNTQVGGFNFGPTEIVFALMVLGWYARTIMRRQLASPHTLHRTFPFITLPLAVYLYVIASSLTVASSLAISLKELVKWVEVLLVVLFIAWWGERKHVLWLLGVMFVATAAEAVVGLYQTIAYVGPDNFTVLLGGRLVMRAYGTFEQPNPFAAYLNYALPIGVSLLISFFLEKRNSEKKGNLGKIEGNKGNGEQFPSFPPISPNLLYLIVFITLPIIVAASFFSLSRGAWLGLVVGCAILLALRSQRALLWFALAILIGVSLPVLGSLNVLPTAIADRIVDVPKFLGLDLFDPRKVEVTPENFGIVDRMAHWFAAWGMFSDHPWLGVGIGNYAVAYYDYNLKEWPFSLGHAHNFYLNMLAETGVIGATCYLLFVGATLLYAWQVARRSVDVWRAIAFGILGSLVAIAVHNFFDNLYVHGLNIQLGLLLGLLSLLRESHEQI
jgi:O-antigen ligase